MGHRDIKSHYRTGHDSLGADFFAPCLSEATRYRRAVGYFSSSALASWGSALLRLSSEGELEIQLLASPKLSQEDIDALASTMALADGASLRTAIVDRLVDELDALAKSPDERSVQARTFAWLVVSGRVELRFAFEENPSEQGPFHEKIGVFDFPNGDRVAFTGSANETHSGLSRNYESVDVYRSWCPEDAARVVVKATQFDEAWEGRAPRLQVEPISMEAIKRLEPIAREPKRGGGPTPNGHEGQTECADSKWRHQDEAIEAFMRVRAGVLEMATGTGKTRTAIRILNTLARTGRVSSAIVTVEGNDLLDQWASELEEAFLANELDWIIYRHYGSKRANVRYARNPKRAVIVVSRLALRDLLDRLPLEARKNMLVVHDEVHGLGAPGHVSSLAGQHRSFGWRLGLSATPERAYDDLGNQFIEAEIGPVFFTFSLKDAIQRGVLVGFDYVPLEYELTPEDRQRLARVYAKQAQRRRDGNPMTKEEVWTDLARVYKTAQQKATVFAKYLQRNSRILDRCIIFVETKEYGEGLLTTLHKYTKHYRTYFDDDQRVHLERFAQGEISSLITCHRVSQGIDIRTLKTVVLFSSARARLETIQRIGRCLRSDPDHPDKRARIIDFVRPQDDDADELNADQVRKTWLEELAQYPKEELGRA